MVDDDWDDCNVDETNRPKGGESTTAGVDDNIVETVERAGGE